MKITVNQNDINNAKKDILLDIKKIASGELTKELNKEIAREVDKANKRLARMNKFQKSLFSDKGITKISRKGTIQDKLKALSQAKIVNESGISTQREYKNYVNRLSKELSLRKDETEFLLGEIDIKTRDFISSSKVYAGTNPQLDFLLGDVIQTSDILKEKLNDLVINTTSDSLLADEIIKETLNQ